MFWLNLFNTKLSPKYWWGGGGELYLMLHCHHQNDSCIKRGSDESYFKVSLTVGGKVTRQHPQMFVHYQLVLALYAFLKFIFKEGQY